MGLKLSRQHRQQLLDWANEAGECECCGLLLGRNGLVERVELARNVAENPEHYFEIDPAALIAAEKEARTGGRQILGYFHSHPNGLAEPSAEDACQATDDGRTWLIVASGTVSSWRFAGTPPLFVESVLVEG